MPETLVLIRRNSRDQNIGAPEYDGQHKRNLSNGRRDASSGAPPGILRHCNSHSTVCLVSRILRTGIQGLHSLAAWPKLWIVQSTTIIYMPLTVHNTERIRIAIASHVESRKISFFTIDNPNLGPITENTWELICR